MINDLWAIVPAGGAGTRLWPLSRADHPKFLLDLTGSGKSLLVETLERLEPLVGSQLMIVTGQAHHAAVQRQASQVSPTNILAEPSGRDSMAAIGWAAAIIERRNPQALVASFAADHVIANQPRFAAAVAEAAQVARDGYIVTIGIAPTYPATGFGYLKLGAPLPDYPTAHQLVNFVEKPDEARAQAWIATGNYRWNAGMFVTQAQVLLDELAGEHPQLAAGLRQLAAEPERLAQLWPTLEAIAIDHAVAEPAAARGRMAVVPGNFGWNDIGDYVALADQQAAALATLGKDVRLIDVAATGLVASTTDRLIAMMGVDDVVVVDTPQVLLVTHRSQAQNLKELVARVRQDYPDLA